MNARENALRIIRFDHPERVVESPPWHQVQFLGHNHEGFDGGGDYSPVGARWTDIWGTGWQKEQEGVMGFPQKYPLAEVKDLRAYPWPDPDDERICGPIYKMAEPFPGGDAFLMGSHRDTLWERAYMLVGMESLMQYFFTEPAFVRDVLHRIMDFHLGIAKHYLAVGVDFASMNDDMGTQTGPLLGTDIVEKFLLREYERIFRLYRENDVMIRFHSCGNIEWMLQTLMKLGVNVLHPVQATANDLDLVRKITQGRVALEGAVSTATIMSGPVEAIEREVRRRMWQLGREGGYFCAPDQRLPFPKDHIQALRAAIEKYGRYPLKPPA